MKKIFLTVSAIFIFLIGGLFYFRSQVYYSHGSLSENQMFEVVKGEGNAEIASRLENEGFVSGKIYFYYLRI